MKRAFLLIGLLATAVSALANGAMGLALEMFEFKTWFVYVAAMLIIEAWMIGRWIGVSWPSSFGVAISANAFTAFCCPAVLTPVLHYSMVGTQANPNPFWNAVALLTSFAFVSAFFESFFWVWSAHKRGKEWVMWRVLLAHLVGVPLALAILLIPPRPYVGLEAFANGARRGSRFDIGRDVALDLMDGNPIPRVENAEQLFRHYAGHPVFGRQLKPIQWEAAYQARFTRFSTGESRLEPIEFNRELAGKKARDLPPETWLIRWKTESGYRQAIILQRDPGSTNQPFVESAFKTDYRVTPLD